jgi:four helix bundle protein
LLGAKGNQGRGIVMKDFRKLKVWEKAHSLTVDVYRASGRFPRSEMLGLTAQIRRACTSIGSNLAEGCGRASDGDLARFAVFAMGSASEVEYQLLLAQDLGYLEGADAAALLERVAEVKRMLSGFIGRLRRAGPCCGQAQADR